MDHINTETHLVFETITDKGKVCSYQTGCFPVTYRRGLKYLFILYSYIANRILPLRAELEITSYMHTKHVMTTSSIWYSIPELIGWIFNNPMP